LPVGAFAATASPAAGDARDRKHSESVVTDWGTEHRSGSDPVHNPTQYVENVRLLVVRLPHVITSWI
jgi:hypothetical protein